MPLAPSQPSNGRRAPFSPDHLTRMIALFNFYSSTFETPWAG
jgi:hypothetical protein